MSVRRSLLALWLFGLLGLPQAILALTATMQGTTRSLLIPGSECLDISGDYSGFRIEAPDRGKVPYVCFSTQRRNVLRFFHVAIVSTNAGVQTRTLEFEHEYFTGPQGLVYAEAQLDGFLATANGADVPTGSRISFRGYFSQHGYLDQIGEALRQEVGETVNSALLEKTSREQYLVGGRRTLKAVLRFSFERVGDKLVLQPETAVALTGVKELVERLGELSTTGGYVPPQGRGGNFPPE
jgi:hypothetical protein